MSIQQCRIGSPPVILSGSFPASNFGIPYSNSGVTASGGRGALTWAIQSDAGVAGQQLGDIGLSIDSITGVLSGSPNEVRRSKNITIRATDVLGVFGEVTFAFKSTGLGVQNYITNNFFIDTSVWSVNQGSIAGGKYTCSAANLGQLVSQSPQGTAPVTAGAVFRVSYTVSGYVNGGVRSNFGGTTGTTVTVRTANGTYSEDITAVSINGIAFASSVTPTGLSIDDADAYEVVT